MRLLYVVQRYGHEVAGGAELHCRQFATRMAGRGHAVEVLTSCALSYVDWANHYPEGTSEIEGVRVHRLPVAHAREHKFFGPLHGRVLWGKKPVPLYLQHEWMRMQGPLVPGIQPWLRERARDYDVVVFITYLYYTTWAGLSVTAGSVPTLLHATAHDEPMLSLPLFDTTFRHPSAFAFLVQEERELIEARFGGPRPGSVVGIGFDLDAVGDADRFRRRYELGDDPYLLFVGRVDPAKGSGELFDYFATYKRRNPGPLRLVVVGEPILPPAPHPDVVVTGFVDESVKHDAYEGALALVQPSYFESFSMVLTEAWVHRTPALVQGHCDVLVGQSLRSNGGLPYHGFEEFEAAVQLLAEQPEVGRALGRQGRRYVEANYQWDVVLDRYTELLRSVTA